MKSGPTRKQSEALAEQRALREFRRGNTKLATLIEDQPRPAGCTCLREHNAMYCDLGLLVPGYADSADGRADEADQRRMDQL